MNVSLPQGTRLYVDAINNIVAYNKEWQYPAQTERAAFESVLKYQALDKDTLYVGFPWATLIDGMRTNKYGVEFLVLELNFLQQVIQFFSKKKVVTVCQHIYMKDFIQYFKAIGITDIFWTHKLKSDDVLKDIQLHAFPLYPAQTMGAYNNTLYTPQVSLEHQLTHKKAKYIANFIGAYNPDIYLSDVRFHIFNDKNLKDYYIVERTEWHFNRIVYRKQMMGSGDSLKELIKEEENTKEYLETMLWSDFTLCPTGSGPNSIRIYESLCLGSIPVILTDTLDLPGSQDIWAQGAIIVSDDQAGYEAAKRKIASLTPKDIVSMRIAGLQLLKALGPDAYSALIMSNI